MDSHAIGLLIELIEPWTDAVNPLVVSNGSPNCEKSIVYDSNETLNAISICRCF